MHSLISWLDVKHAFEGYLQVNFQVKTNIDRGHW